jgi:hypothetical protein
VTRIVLQFDVEIEGEEKIKEDAREKWYAQHDDVRDMLESVTVNHKHRKFAQTPDQGNRRRDGRRKYR